MSDSTKLRTLAVGEPYYPGRTSVPGFPRYAFLHGRHELVLFRHGRFKSALKSFRDGDAEFAFVINGCMIVFLYRFGDALPWDGTPYSWGLYRHQEQAVPEPLPTLESRVLLHAILVDAGRNIVRALRAIPLSPVFSHALHGAISDQAAKPWDEKKYDRDTGAVPRRWPSMESLLAAAVARTNSGE